MSWTVTRQSQWPDGTLIVEISAGGLDYTNPGALSAKYPGEFQTFNSKVEAIKTGIEIALAWQKDHPEKTIYIGTGGTGGMTMPFDALPLKDEAFKDLLEEAAEHDEDLPKCGRCGEIIDDIWRNENSSWSGDKFCSENCANLAQEDDDDSKCRECHGDNTDGEGYDGMCGNCADKAERAKRPKTREVEVARAWSGNQGDRGEWDTYFYDIPIDTPEDQIEAVALKVAAEEIAQNTTANDHLQHLWIYSIPDLEEGAEDDEEEEAIT